MTKIYSIRCHTVNEASRLFAALNGLVVVEQGQEFLEVTVSKESDMQLVDLVADKVCAYPTWKKVYNYELK